MNSLKQKTINGLTWSLIDNISRYGIQFIAGIILARLLTPKEFGLIGMIAIFIAISSSFVNSGFTQAIIRKRDATQTDYSTIFYFNITTSIIFYFVLFFASAAISNFFKEPKLVLIVKLLGLTLIFDSFAIVQRAKLTKRINFKLQTRVSVIASISSGIIGIIMAYAGYGVWSLVVKLLARHALTSLFLWIWNKWKPTLEFSIKAFKEMFSFGYKLLLSGLLNTAYQNIYLLIIGKFFSATELGYYTRADQFKKLPSQNITTVIQRVSYPVLSEMQNDIPKLKEAYRRLIKSTMLITFTLMLILAAVAKPLILTLIGEKWLPSVIYLQLLCFSGMLYPLHAINLNMLQVQGRSDLFLNLEIAKKILAVPAIIIGVYFGIQVMIIAMTFNSFIAFFLNSYYSGKLIGYSSLNQLKDILPSFLLAVFVGSVVFFTGYLLEIPNLFKLLIQIFLGIALSVGIAELLCFNDYLYLKEIISQHLKEIKDNKHDC